MGLNDSSGFALLVAILGGLAGVVIAAVINWLQAHRVAHLQADLVNAGASVRQREKVAQKLWILVNNCFRAQANMKQKVQRGEDSRDAAMEILSSRSTLKNYYYDNEAFLDPALNPLIKALDSDLKDRHVLDVGKSKAAIRELLFPRSSRVRPPLGIGSVFVVVTAIAVVLYAVNIVFPSVPRPVSLALLGTLPALLLALFAPRGNGSTRGYRIAVAGLWCICYVFSTGPMTGLLIWLRTESTSSVQTCFDRFYSPVFWASKQSPELGRLIHSYKEDWEAIGERIVDSDSYQADQALPEAPGLIEPPIPLSPPKKPRAPAAQ